MTTLEEVRKNLEKLVGRKFSGSELYDEIVIAFSDYEYEGESYVQVTEHDDYYEAYINHEDAEVFEIYFNKEWNEDEQEYEYTVTKIY